MSPTVFCSAKGIVDDAERRGKAPPLSYDAEGRASALAFIERCTDVASGVVRDPAGPGGVSNDTATAMGAMVLLIAGEDPKTNGPLARALAYLAQRAPRVAEDGAVIDPLAVVFGAFATFHASGDVWKAWNSHLSAVLQNTRTGGTPCDDRGAYDVAEPLRPAGGRLATCSPAPVEAVPTRCWDHSLRPGRQWPTYEIVGQSLRELHIGE